MLKPKSLHKSLLLLVGLLAVFVCVCVHTSPHQNKVWDKVAPNVFQLIGKNGAGGTGFQLVTKTGTVIVTNSHVCELAVKNTLIVKNHGHSMRLDVLKVDTRSDLCLVEPWPVSSGLRLGEDVNVEDKVIAIGYPNLGPLKMVEGEVTAIDSIFTMHHLMPTKNKDVNKFLRITGARCNLPKNKMMFYAPQFFSMFTTEKVPVCMSEEKNALQTNLPIYPGNSGSPLMNKSGDVVGVIFATNTETHEGYAVNLYHLHRLLKDYKNHSK